MAVVGAVGIPQTYNTAHQSIALQRRATHYRTDQYSAKQHTATHCILTCYRPKQYDRSKKTKHVTEDKQHTGRNKESNIRRSHQI